MADPAATWEPVADRAVGGDVAFDSDLDAPTVSDADIAAGTSGPVDLPDGRNGMPHSRGEAFLLALVENGWDSVVLVEPDGIMSYATPAISRVLGYPLREIVGTNGFDLIHPDDVGNARELFQRAVAHPGRGVAAYCRFRHRDGGYRQLEGLINDQSANPAVAGVVINFRDITDRRRTEESLRDSEERYRSVLDALEEGVLLAGSDGVILACNAAAENIIGLPADAVVGRPLDDARWLTFREDGTPFPRAEFPGLVTLRTGRRCSGVVMGLQRPTGENTWLSINSRPLNALGGGAPGAVVISFSDITERLRASRGLRESEALHQSLVESLPQAIFRKDAAGRFTFGNRRLCELLGLTPDRLIGQTDHDLFPPELAEKYRGDDLHVLKTGRLFTDAEEVVTRKGRILVQVVKTPVADATGRLIGIQGLFWDITETKRLEDDLRRRTSELEAANRVLRETQGQMIQQEKLASLGQLTARVAHEVNNPLAFVTNNIAVLERDLRSVVEIMELYRTGLPTLEHAKPDIVREIRRAETAIDIRYTLDNLDRLIASSRGGVKRVQQIVADLRQFSRLDRADREQADLDQCLATTLQILIHEFRKRSLTVVTDFGKVVDVHCYPQKLNQVFLNLLMNAVQASEEGKRIWVSTRRNGESAVVEVRDEGCGMTAEVQARIFDPFFTTKPPGEGTGLGLSICYGIVCDHEGRIEVDTVVGQGTAFRVVLPMKTPARPAGQGAT